WHLCVARRLIAARWLAAAGADLLDFAALLQRPRRRQLICPRRDDQPIDTAERGGLGLCGESRQRLHRQVHVTEADRRPRLRFVLSRPEIADDLARDVGLAPVAHIGSARLVALPVPEQVIDE